MAPRPRVILITGSSSGFGRQLAEIALANGDNVVATLRKPEVDVTKEDDILNAFVKAKEKFRRIDVVYNNAGYSISSAVEATPDDAARAVFETNFWGSTRVSREAVRFFRDENPKDAGGRLIVTSSLVGLNAYASFGFYSATKYAVEAITQALAGEIDPNWNIKITLVEPGTFRTEGIKSNVIYPAPEVYQADTTGYAKVTSQLAALEKPGFKVGDAQKGSQKLYELSTTENPPLRLVLGQDSIYAARSQLEGVLKDIAAYESWSADLRED